MPLARYGDKIRAKAVRPVHVSVDNVTRRFVSSSMTPVTVVLGFQSAVAYSRGGGAAV